MSSNQITIKPPDQDAADFLLDQWVEALTRCAKVTGGDINIDWGGDFVYAITPTMATIKTSTDNDQPIPVRNKVFGAGLGFDANALNILERMQSSDKPMSICDLETDNQEWVNQPLTEMLRLNYQNAVELNMRDYWEEDALNYVKRILRQQRRLEHHYQADLPYTKATFSSTFEVIEFGLTPNQPSRLKRLVTIHHYEPVTSISNV